MTDAKDSHGSLQTLQLAPDVFEIIKSLFARKPFSGAYRAFGKAAPGLGVVAKIDGIGGRLENNLMHTDHVSFAKRRDLEFHAGSVLYHITQNGGGAGGRVLFVDMMALENLSGVVVRQGSSGGAGDVEKQIHAYGKIPSIKQAAAARFH